MKIRSLALIISGAAALTACGGSSGSSGNNAPEQTQQGEQKSGEELQLMTEVATDGVENGIIRKSDTTISFSVKSAEQIPEHLKLERYECKFGETTEWKPCSVDTFDISNLRNGDVVDFLARAVFLDVRAQSLVFAQQARVNFRVQLTDSSVVGTTTLPAGVNAVRALTDKVQVGSAYEVTVPAGMHITEYSTSKTTGVLSFFRILPESDPYYLGNHSCARDWDRVVAGMSPANATLLYCHSTPTRAAYKIHNEYRLAYNHVEVATDTNLVAAENQERLSFSIYDADYDLMPTTSRFNEICQNAQKHKIDVPMIPNFFLGRNPETVDFWICDVYLPDMNGRSVQWRAGAFYNTDQIDWNCDDCRYPRAIETVYLSRVNASIHMDANFAKVAQKRVFETVSKLTP
jgi:hypothetical protein